MVWPSCWPGSARMVAARGPRVPRATRPGPAGARSAPPRAGRAAAAAGPGPSRPGRGVAGLAAGAQDRGQGAPQPGFGNRRQRLGQGVLGEPGGLVQPAGRGQGLGGGHRAGQRAGVGRGCQLQCAQRQVGGGLRRRTQCPRRRGVKTGQRRWVPRMRGLQQVTGGQGCGFATAEQDLADTGGAAPSALAAGSSRRQRGAAVRAGMRTRCQRRS